jgi:arylsulfatase A-like enzyme
MLDALTLDFARATISATGLGRDSIPDLLSVSLSATDRVGHEFGPLSREQLDNLLRLDRQLEEFFTFLDSTVGRDRWLVALLADHGAGFAPEDLQASGDTTARRWTPEEAAALGAARSRAGPSIQGGADPEQTVAALESLDFVSDAWTLEQLLEDPPADSFSLLLSRSVYPGRVSGDFGGQGVLVRYEENWVSRARGVGHGSPYWFDRHVPMIFMGPGISAGRESLRVSTVDLAPTLARLLRIPFPDDLDGIPLEDVIGERPAARAAAIGARPDADD